jgi:hypothetical protein
MKRKRKLSTIEHLLEGNILCVVRLTGSFHADQLRSALSRVQRKHPALRALIREESDGLYYELDSEVDVPLRIVAHAGEEVYRRECETELTTDFAYGQVQLRVVWLQGDSESDLLFTTSHRICDGMSVFTIVREVLRSIHSDEELIPYQPITEQDIIGNYLPPQLWKRKLTATLINGLLRLIPSSRRAPDKNEHSLEWRADRALSDAIKQRCRAEGVSLHAFLAGTLDRALLTVFGKKKMPRWIDSQIDPRRGRSAALRSDMLFPGGGSFRMRTGQASGVESWTWMRTLHEEIRRKVGQEALEIPRRFHFFGMLHAPTAGQLNSILRMNCALRMKNGLSSFPLSNLGNVAVLDEVARFRLKDLRLYIHSFKSRAVGLVTYTVNGEMRFYCLSDENCMTRSQVATLKREFMALLQYYVIPSEHGAEEASLMVKAIAG